MAIPSFETLTDRLVAATDAYLEADIPYAADGATYADVKARVDYGEMFRDGMTGVIVDSEIVISLSKLQVATKPTKTARLTLPRQPGKTFAVMDVRDAGTDWTVRVERA